MSVCMKNLIGCLVGQENKKKAHTALAGNILNLTREIQVHLHIVDGIIAMEGLGPSRGTPVRTGTVLIGSDPLFLDLVCARFAGIPWQSVGALAGARARGLISDEFLDQVRSFPLAPWPRPFDPARPGPLAAFIHHPKRQRYFLAIRNTPLFDRLCNTRWFGRCLVALGLRQDDYDREELSLGGLSLDRERCTGCGICRDHCPMDLPLPDILGDPDLTGCISCLYCFCVCPQEAILFHGNLGYMNEQMRQYGTRIRSAAAREQLPTDGCPGPESVESER
jgi:ferredoxin